MIVSCQLKNILSHSPLMPWYHAESILDAMEMQGNNRIMLNVAMYMYWSTFFTLLITIQLQMDIRREAMERLTTLIVTSPRFAPQTKMILNFSTSVLFESNRSLTEKGLGTVSVGTFHNWLKKHRSYVGICPSL